MRGITEERLKEIKENYNQGTSRRLIEYLLDDECEELNAWQPIETAPLNKPIRLIKKTQPQHVGEIMLDSHREFFTHWQELPEDPK